jgi:hypothetical protein
MTVFVVRYPDGSFVARAQSWQRTDDITRARTLARRADAGVVARRRWYAPEGEPEVLEAEIKLKEPA